MKKLILFILLCSFFACKKDPAQDITKYSWVLEKAVVSPAITVNGKATTDYKNAYGSESCLASNYTYTFLNTGIFQVSSTGALCDMVANNETQKWVKNGDEIRLSGSNSYGIQLFIVTDNFMKNTSTFTNNGVNYTVDYTYKAKSK